MRQLMVDIKADEVFDSGDEVSPASLLRIDGSLRAGRLLIQPLRDRILGFMDEPLSASAPAVHREVRARLQLLLRPRGHDTARSDDVSALRLLKAERFIDEHLAERELDAEAVANHMAMSLRNLNRVFETNECSVTQWIWQERLALAHRQLADAGHSGRSIGDIALGCGFTTQAHFAREFKQRYGATPTQHRQAPVGAS
jgi:AraC-like DNA-binding protein